MRNLTNLAMFAAPVLFTCLAAGEGPFRVEPDDQCVVADRLTGTWEPDAALAETLGTKARFSRVEITADASVAAKVPAKYEEFLGGRQIYLAGTLALTTTKGARERYPFILVEFGGNQNIVTFRERGGDPFGDGESAIVTVVPAKARSNDLMFMGGDFNNEPFKAFRRVADAE